jgi:hypothetical protein
VVVGSNPAAPTNKQKKGHPQGWPFFCLSARSAGLNPMRGFKPGANLDSRRLPRRGEAQGCAESNPTVHLCSLKRNVERVALFCLSARSAGLSRIRGFTNLPGANLDSRRQVAPAHPCARDVSASMHVTRRGEAQGWAESNPAAYVQWPRRRIPQGCPFFIDNSRDTTRIQHLEVPVCQQRQIVVDEGARTGRPPNPTAPPK